MCCLPSRNGPSSCGGLDGAAGDARRAAGAERLDERALGGRGLAAIRTEQVDRAAHRLCALQTEADELAPPDLVGDDELRNEADAEAGGNGALDGLVGVQLPALRGPVADAG